MFKGAGGALGSSKLKKKWFFPKSNLFRSNYALVPVLNFLVLYCNDICMKMGLKPIFLGYEIPTRTCCSFLT